MARLPRIASRKVEADVLVVGGGLAGLMAAIRARDFVPKVVLVDKAKAGKSGCSPFAAGIYNAAFPEDDADLWVKEVIESGDYLADQDWVKLQAEIGFSIVGLMDQWSREFGLPIFEKDEKGRFVRRKSRGHLHTSHMVVNALPMMEVLRRKALEREVLFQERSMVTDLLVKEGAVTGAIGFNYRTGQIFQLLSKAVVLAAGGCSFKGIFVGHKNLTGDGQAAALKAGAIFRGMEQCGTNTCYKDFDIHGMNLMVNVGGRFLNSLGEEFMWKYNPDLGNRALLPDLALAFCHEVKEGRGPIYLDATAAKPADRALCRKILPESFKAWDRAGIDPFATKLEWVPAFGGTRGTSGGMEIDLECRSSLANLFGAGDTSSVALASAGLGGIPLAYASVSGYRAGEYAARQASDMNSPKPPSSQWEKKVKDFVSPLLRTKGISPDELINDLQSLLFPYPICYLKKGERLKDALQGLQNLKARVGELKAGDWHELIKANEAIHMITIAEAFLSSSLFREESRGYHFREDFPRIDNVNWLKWVMLQQNDTGFKLWARDIPTSYLRPHQDYSPARGMKRTG